MIKEIFDIEPIQKNTLILFLALFFITFLQVFLFKPEIFEKGVFITIGISLALTVSWTILNIPSMIMFVIVTQWKEGKLPSKKSLILENVVLTAGIIIIGWILMLTYISYELDLSFKTLIRIGILISFIKFLLWTIINFIESPKNKKKTEK